MPCWHPIRYAPFVLVVAAVIVVRLLVNFRFGLYSRRWRFASVPDLTRIALAAFTASLIAFSIVEVGQIVTAATGPVGFPRSFWLIELLLSVGGHRRCPARDPVRLRLGARTRAPRPARHARPTLFYGAGRTGVMMARSAQSQARSRRRAGRVPR